MFDKLIVSNPGRGSLTRSMPSGILSFVAHGVLIGAGAFATANTQATTAATHADTTIFFTPTSQAVPVEKAEQPIHRVEQKPVALGFQLIDFVTEVPVGIPDVDVSYVIDPRDYTGNGEPGGVHDGVNGGQTTDQETPYLLDLVDEAPEVLSCPTPRYPSNLARAGMPGRVVFELVVTPAGNVDEGSIRTRYSDHVEFEREALQSLLRCRFRPGRLRGRAVNVLVELPFEFARRR